MDEMRSYEVIPILAGLSLTDRNGWERTRLQVYSVASMFSKNQLSLQDILTFPWENTIETHNVEISDADRQRLKERADAIAATLRPD